MSRIQLYIREDEEAPKNILTFPPNTKPSLGFIQSAFPGTNGLSYEDEDSKVPGIVLFLNDGEMLEPPNGFSPKGRTYKIRRESSVNESIRSKNFAFFLNKKREDRLTPSHKYKPPGSSLNKQQKKSSAAITVRMGRFNKDRIFTPIHPNSTSYFGGKVRLLDVDIERSRPTDIKNMAIFKFKNMDTRFNANISYVLCRRDGKMIEDFFSDGKPFSIKEYSQLYSIPHFDRLPFFLCSSSNFEGSEEDNQASETSSFTSRFSVDDSINNTHQKHMDNSKPVTIEGLPTSTFATKSTITSAVSKPILPEFPKHHKRKRKATISKPPEEEILANVNIDEPGSTQPSFDNLITKIPSFKKPQLPNKSNDQLNLRLSEVSGDENYQHYYSTFRIPCPNPPKKAMVTTEGSKAPLAQERYQQPYNEQGTSIKTLNIANSKQFLPLDTDSSERVLKYIDNDILTPMEITQPYQSEVENYKTNYSTFRTPLPVAKNCNKTPKVKENRQLNAQVDEVERTITDSNTERVEQSQVRENYQTNLSTFRVPKVDIIDNTFTKVQVNRALKIFGKSIIQPITKTYNMYRLDIAADLKEVKWGPPTEITLITERTRFASGGMRDAFKAWRPTENNPTFVIKRHHPAVLDAFVNKYGNTKVAMEKLCEKEVQTQMYARILTDQMKPPGEFGEKPRFISCRKLVDMDGDTFTIEPFLDGTWQKANSNGGKILDNVSTSGQKLNTLTHWTISYTNNLAALIDLQGVDLALSDAEIATKAESLFGAGNIGIQAISNFKQHHRCSKYCKMLGLSSFTSNVIETTPQHVNWNEKQRLTPPDKTYSPIDTEVYFKRGGVEMQQRVFNS